MSKENTSGLPVSPEIFAKFVDNHRAKSLVLAQEVLDNYPECSSDWIRCTDWGSKANGTYYKKMDFRVEVNDGVYETRVVTPELLAESVLKFWVYQEAGMGLGDAYAPSDFWDSGTWDQNSFDSLMQFHFWGKVIYE